MRPCMTENAAGESDYIAQLMFFRQFKRLHCQGLGTLKIPHYFLKRGGIKERGGNHIRVAFVLGRHHQAVALAANLGSAQHPRVARSCRKHRYARAAVAQEIGVVKEFQAGCEMLFDAGEIASQMAGYYLQKMNVPENPRPPSSRSEPKGPIGQLAGSK